MQGLNPFGNSCRPRWINYLRPDIKREVSSLRRKSRPFFISIHSHKQVWKLLLCFAPIQRSSFFVRDLLWLAWTSAPCNPGKNHGTAIIGCSCCQVRVRVMYKFAEQECFQFLLQFQPTISIQETDPSSLWNIDLKSLFSMQIPTITSLLAWRSSICKATRTGFSFSDYQSGREECTP